MTENGDCNDNNNEIYPGAQELCDGLDNNCDGETDEECECITGRTKECYSGPEETKNTGECKAGTKTCDEQGKWSECEEEKLPEAEACGDNKDNDCDGTIDEYDEQTEAEEICADGLDNNCNGEIDEGCDTEVEKRLIGEEGGEIIIDGVKIVIPERALDKKIEITVERVDNAPGEPGFYPVSPAYKIGPEDTVFLKDIFVIIPYSQELIPKDGKELTEKEEVNKEKDIKVFKLPKENSNWEELPSTVDTDDKTVTGITGSFSYFQAGLVVSKSSDNKNSDRGCSCSALK